VTYKAGIIAGVVTIMLVVVGGLVGLNVTNGSAGGTDPPIEVERYVALGDSIPYGQGLANPYPTTRMGTGSAVSQGPSGRAWPGLLSEAVGMKVRSSDCDLSGDQLSVSGAPASAADAATAGVASLTSPSFQCAGPNWSVQGTELSSASLAAHPAFLVTIQAGADDIGFSNCLEYELTRALGSACVSGGSPVPAVTAELNNARSAITSMIEQVAPHTQAIEVVDYYNPVPSPTDFDPSSIHVGSDVDPICLGLQAHEPDAYNDAVILTRALNDAISQAVQNAKRAGVHNVALVDIATLERHHEMCTAEPALFSGEPLSQEALQVDLGSTLLCHAEESIASMWTSAAGQSSACRAAASATNDLRAHVWRAAHPNAGGQRDIATAVLATLLRFPADSQTP
jgi:hypothetical protein